MGSTFGSKFFSTSFSEFCVMFEFLFSVATSLSFFRFVLWTNSDLLSSLFCEDEKLSSIDVSENWFSFSGTSSVSDSVDKTSSWFSEISFSTSVGFSISSSSLSSSSSWFSKNSSSDKNSSEIISSGSFSNSTSVFSGIWFYSGFSGTKSSP